MRFSNLNVILEIIIYYTSATFSVTILQSTAVNVMSVQLIKYMKSNWNTR